MTPGPPTRPRPVCLPTACEPCLPPSAGPLGRLRWACTGIEQHARRARNGQYSAGAGRADGSAASARPRPRALDDVRGHADVPGGAVEPLRLPAAVVFVLVADAGQPIGGGALVGLQRLLGRGEGADLRHFGPPGVTR